MSPKLRFRHTADAGFDTLCLRLAPQYPDVQLIELDHPATSAARAKGIVLEGQSTNLFQIAADLGERPLSTVLSESGRWDTALGSALVAEGLLQYLTDEEVRALHLTARSATCAFQADRASNIFMRLDGRVPRNPSRK